MRNRQPTTQFKKDWKREKKGQHRKTLEDDIGPILVSLANDEPLPASNRDHALTGDLVGMRDCHIKPDLVLIYRKEGDVDGNLILARLGSHSELGL